MKALECNIPKGLTQFSVPPLSLYLKSMTLLFNNNTPLQFWLIINL